ncbi:glycosyltransferase [Salsipaludibacter albus]|uniref:glycosyltransferase n=1 Tax=Salsipaludibacter albus TaxID=2849650 RepID=UPI001EE452DC|nr:glycosyltransferase [Salsipaludibacter albus]
MAPVTPGGSPPAGPGATHRRPRALHLCTRYLRGGSERRVRDVVAALPEVDHVVVVGAESDLDLARHQLAPARVVVAPDLVRAVDPVRDARCLRWLLRLPGLVACDVVYTHQSKAGVLGRVAVRLRGGPPVVHSLSMATFGDGYGRLEGGLQRLAETALVPLTAGWVVVGADLAEKYRRIGADPARLHVVRSGAPLPDASRRSAAARADVARRLGLDPRRPVVLSLGSLDARKRVLALPELLVRLQATTSSDPQLVIAGEGPQARELSARVDELGLADDVAMPGWVSPVDDLLLAADVVVLLSRAEGLPQVLLQAAAAGTPFVAHPVDGVAELRALGAEGRVVAHDDLDAAVAAVAELLAADAPRAPRPSIRAALGEWSPDVIRSRHREVWAATTGRSPERHGRTTQRPPVVVEFLGLPGSGKSTLAAAVATAMRVGTVTTAGTGAGTPTPARLARKVGAVVSEAVTHPGPTAVATVAVATSGQGDPRAVARRTVAWVVAQRLLGRARAGGVDAVLDEGTLQATWSLGLVGDHRGLLEAWMRDRRWLRPDVVVVLRPPTAVVEARLARRADPHSRIEQVTGDQRSRMVGHGARVLDDLVGSLGRLGVPHDRVVQVSIGPHDTVDATTEVVLAALGHCVPDLVTVPPAPPRRVAA